MSFFITCYHPPARPSPTRVITKFIFKFTITDHPGRLTRRLTISLTGSTYNMFLYYNVFRFHDAKMNYPGCGLVQSTKILCGFALKYVETWYYNVPWRRAKICFDFVLQCVVASWYNMLCLCITIYCVIDNMLWFHVTMCYCELIPEILGYAYTLCGIYRNFIGLSQVYS